jgi:hypothetical protein
MNVSLACPTLVTVQGSACDLNQDVDSRDFGSGSTPGSGSLDDAAIRSNRYGESRHLEQIIMEIAVCNKLPHFRRIVGYSNAG